MSNFDSLPPGNGYAKLISQNFNAEVMERMAEAVDGIEGGIISPNTVGFC